MGQRWGGAGRGGSKKCKPIPTPPRDAGLKSQPIPAPPPLQGRENPHEVKRGGAGQAGRGKIAIPTRVVQMEAKIFNQPVNGGLGFQSNNL